MRTGLRKSPPLVEVRTRTSDLQQVYRVERSRLAAYEDAFRKDIQRLWTRVQTREITLAQMSKIFSNDLYVFQTKMYQLGKRTLGDFRNVLTLDDLRVLHGQHAHEMRWFKGMVKQIRAHETVMPIPHRMDLYALGGYSVYLRGAMSVLPDDIRWGWRVNPEKEHCNGCLWRQEESRRTNGFSVNDLFGEIGLPTEKTPCRHRCGCEIYPIGIDVRLNRTRPTAFSYVAGLLQHGKKR